ncbi:MAG: type IV secretion protein IcmC [Tatlockia sp.]|nr:type IV secretion protein IcmC [Tatlockia sp.]
MSTSPDLVTIIGNFSHSLYPIQRLLTGFAYLMGLAFFILALMKLKKIGESRGQSQEKPIVPLAYLLGGAALLFLPSAVTTLSNTVFGAGNILGYVTYNPYSIYNSMGLLVQTAGVLWFIRGCVLLVGASQPGETHGTKGLVFLCAGILAMNFQNTTAAVNAALTYLMSLTGPSKGGS